MLKRMFLICLAILMVASMLTACGSKKSKKEPKEDEIAVDVDVDTEDKEEEINQTEQKEEQEEEKEENEEDSVEIEIDDGVNEEEVSDEDSVINFDDLLSAAS